MSTRPSEHSQSASSDDDQMTARQNALIKEHEDKQRKSQIFAKTQCSVDKCTMTPLLEFGDCLASDFNTRWENSQRDPERWNWFAFTCDMHVQEMAKAAEQEEKKEDKDAPSLLRRLTGRTQTNTAATSRGKQLTASTSQFSEADTKVDQDTK